MRSKTGMVLCASAFAAGPIAGLAPLGLAALLHVTGLLSLVAYRIDHKRWPVPRYPVVLPLCVLLVYLAASCLWTTAPSHGWVKLVELTALAASAVVVPVAVRDMPAGDTKAVRTLMLYGWGVGFALCFGDLAAGGPIKRLHWRWPTLPVNAYDREIIALGLLLWPAALVAFRRGGRIPAVVALAAYTIGILFLQSHSAMAGMVLGLAVLALSTRFPATVRGCMMAVVAAGFLACVPVAFLMSHYGADHWDMLQFSFRHRVQIWSFTAERILHWPFFGLGLDSSRNIPVADLAPGFLSLAADKPPLHPHNMFLQLWLELGGVGCAIAFAVIARVLCATRYVQPPSQAFVMAASAAVLTIASFAFGIWQGWWLALISLLAIFLLVAALEKESE